MRNTKFSNFLNLKHLFFTIATTCNAFNSARYLYWIYGNSNCGNPFVTFMCWFMANALLRLQNYIYRHFPWMTRCLNSYKSSATHLIYACSLIECLHMEKSRMHITPHVTHTHWHTAIALKKRSCKRKYIKFLNKIVALKHRIVKRKWQAANMVYWNFYIML